MNTATKRKEIEALVKSQGYHIDINEWPRKLTFYNREGMPLPNMPADPWSMERCLNKGFTLTPPNQPTSEPITVEAPAQPSGGETQPEKSDAELDIVDEAIASYGNDLTTEPDAPTLAVKRTKAEIAEAKKKRVAKAKRKQAKLDKAMADSKN